MEGPEDKCRTSKIFWYLGLLLGFTWEKRQPAVKLGGGRTGRGPVAPFDDTDVQINRMPDVFIHGMDVLIHLSSLPG